MSDKHPLMESPKHTYPQLCAKVRKRYGVDDAEHWYRLTRRGILDLCKPDPHGFRDYETLEDWWVAQQLKWRYQREAAA